MGFVSSVSLRRSSPVFLWLLRAFVPKLCFGSCVRDYCSHICKSGERSPCVYRNSAQMTGSVLETRQSRLLNALSKVLDEPVASRPAGHLEARSNVGIEVPSRQDDEFFGFPGHVEGREGLVCNRQVIPRCNDHEQRSRAD